MPTIIDIIDEPKRGCGFRKEGGLYMRLDGAGAGCGKLPVILDICPACGQGVKFARSWTWINPSRLMVPGPCGDVIDPIAGGVPGTCLGAACVLCDPPEKAGLIWIGEAHYKTPADWLKEAHEQGVSRRIKTVPHGFKIGEHWVMLAHKKVRQEPCRECPASGEMVCPACKGKGTVWKSGIFHVFRPDRIEYIVTGKEPDEELERLEERGFTLVRLTRTDGEG
jgi:hypothetical protein